MISKGAISGVFGNEKTLGGIRLSFTTRQSCTWVQGRNCTTPTPL